jgi:xanthine dehydrogenase accessory factor
MKSIHHKILEQLRTGSGTVVATVLRTAGSTPQKPGSTAVFGEEGLIAGTVGGGVLEKEVQHIAESVMISGASDHFYFDLDSDQDPNGAICGGTALVLVDAEPVRHLTVMEEMERTLADQGDGFLLTTVSEKQERGRTIKRYWIKRTTREEIPPGLEPSLRKLIQEQLKTAVKLGFTEINLKTDPEHSGEVVFVEHIRPNPHLIIAGAGHIGKALAHLASLLEFAVTVVDDRPEYADKSVIPDADRVIVQPIGEALKDLVKGRNVYVVIVTRGHQHDSEALRACIGSGALYVGMIGSRHKVAVIKRQFLDEHWAEPDQLSAIYAPIGLDIGSKTIQEIAISIAAQLVEVRNHNKEADAT